MVLAQHAERLAADLVEDADPRRRRLQARPRRVQPVELEHGADAAVRADDLGLGTCRHHLVAKLEEECGGGAVERVHRRQVEGQVHGWRTGQAAHALPRGEALPEAQLPAEAQRGPAVPQVDPLDVEAGIVGVGHARGEYR